MEEKTTGQENMKDRSGRIDMTLFAIYMFFILLAAVIIGRIVYIQIFYKPESIYGPNAGPYCRTTERLWRHPLRNTR